jgi:hypothetical protein
LPVVEFSDPVEHELQELVALKYDVPLPQVTQAPAVELYVPLEHVVASDAG